ncbi:adenylyl-sulfate kinase [Arthrobacter sp.]|uniref:adenylyl-sulfate kinase n=1 Tax=Arthrobacter sp. TaxID=1667 RepID=UPI0028125662|nr:adenylyl-sulfate kinase [Arthrobacter sp.]
MTPHAGALPWHVLSDGALDELELLLGGLYAPAHGYCLPSSVPVRWPTAVTLLLPRSVGERAVRESALLLCDPDGTPLALLTVSGFESAPGTGIYLAGALSPLKAAEHPPLRHLRITEPLASAAGRKFVVSAFSKPPLAAQMARAVSVAASRNADLCLVAVTGPQQHGRYTALELMTVLEQCAAEVPGSSSRLLVLRSPARSGNREDELIQELVFRNLGANVLLDFTVPDEPQAGIDHARFGHRPSQAMPNQSIPSQSLPAHPVSGNTGAGSTTGSVVFFTGLSGSGKSTIARALAQRLQAAGERTVTLLDGDDVRRLLSSGLGFSKEDRETNIRRIGWVASLIAASGGDAVCAPIAPFDSTRREVRAMAPAGSFILVHVSTPLSVCEARDRKGLYARARAGQIPEFTGISSPYEVPADADLVINTAEVGVDAAVAAIMDALSLRRTPSAMQMIP